MVSVLADLCQRCAEHLYTGFAGVAVFAQIAAELFAASLTMKEPKQMFGDGIQRCTGGQALFKIGDKGLRNFDTARNGVFIPVVAPIDLAQQWPGVLICLAPD